MAWDSAKPVGTDLLTNSHAQIRANWLALQQGWLDAGEAWSYASGTTITVPTDATIKYSVGMKIKITQATGGIKYFYIIGVAATLLTITAGSDYTLNNETISSPYFSTVENPLGFPGYFNGTKSIFKITGKHLEQCGWDFITGTGGSPFGNKTITFPLPFKTNTYPKMACAMLNSINGSDPTDINSFVTAFTECVISTMSVTSSDFSARWYKTTGNLDNGYRIGMSYIAIGVIA